MKAFKNKLTMVLVTIILTTILTNNFYRVKGSSIDNYSKTPIKIGVFAKDLTDDYLIFIRENFEDIEKKNQGKVIFSFYDAKFNEATQMSDIENSLKENIDLLLVDLVDISKVKDIINEVAKYNVPIIFFNREPLTMEGIQSYKKALYVGTDSRQAGILQGKMIINAWNKYKEYIDKNKDNVLQYILLIGERNNKVPADRSTYSISTIQQDGIKTEELASTILNWNTETGRTAIESLFLKYGDRIEAIISNDDSMAIGAVQALQKYGYNNGNIAKTIPVVGVDAVPEARELISKGFMLGSPLQDPLDMVNAIYTIGLNLVYGRNPVEGTSYSIDETGAAVRVPFEEYTGPMYR